MSVREQRAHPRVHVSTRARVRFPAAGTNGGTPPEREVRLVDLSWGGARFADSGPPGSPGDPVDVLLPLAGGRLLTLGASIRRSEQVGSAWHVAIRFDRVDPAAEEGFERLLEMLVTPAQEHHVPPVARQLEVLYGDNDELDAALAAIEEGRLALLLPETVGVGQSFRLTLGCMRHTESLTLRARVEEQEVLRRGGYEVFRSKLHFEHPQEALREGAERLRRRARRHADRASFQRTVGLGDG